MLINLQAGHDEQGNGIDTVVLEHLGIVLVEDLLEEGKRYLRIGYGSYELLLLLTLKITYTRPSKYVSLNNCNAELAWPGPEIKHLLS